MELEWREEDFWATLLDIFGDLYPVEDTSLFSTFNVVDSTLTLLMGNRFLVVGALCSFWGIILFFLLFSFAF